MLINDECITEFLGKKVEPKILCQNIGLVNTILPNSLSFLDDIEFLDKLNANHNISAVFTTNALSEKLRKGIISIIVDDPRYYFYSFLNFFSTRNYNKTPSVISASASIHPKAFVSDYNVMIGEHVCIEPNATILPDVKIGDHVIVRAGTVIGSEGFEYKRTSKGILSVKHDGRVIIGNHVEIGSNTSIDKGFSFRDTIIGEHTKIDNLVHIAHSVHIGKECFIIANSMIGGSCTIQDRVWIGPSASIAPQIIIEDEGFVSLGSVVTKNVGKGEWVTGNFAIPHSKFLQNLKKNLQ